MRSALRHALEASPRETCGLILRSSGVVSLDPISNACCCRGRFAFDGLSWAAAWRAAQRRGALIVGAVHAHHDEGTALSRADRSGLASLGTGLRLHLVVSRDGWAFYSRSHDGAWRPIARGRAPVNP